MQPSRVPIHERVSLALALLGLASSTGPPTLAAWGIELGPGWRYPLTLITILSVIGALVTLGWPWLPELATKVKRVIRRYLWIVGGPMALGLLLGGMEWLLSNLPYRALGIGLTAFMLALIGFVVRERRLAKQLTSEKNELLRSLLSNSQPKGTHTRATATVGYPEVSAAVERLKAENKQLRDDREAQVRARSFELSEYLEKFLEDCEQESLQKQDVIRRYNQRFSGKVGYVINDLKRFKVGHSQKRENLKKIPENRQDIQKLAEYLRGVGQKHW